MNLEHHTSGASIRNVFSPAYYQWNADHRDLDHALQPISDRRPRLPRRHQQARRQVPHRTASVLSPPPRDPQDKARRHRRWELFSLRVQRLVRRARTRGDAAARDFAITLCTPVVQRWARRLCDDRRLLDDSTGEAMLALVRSVDRYPLDHPCTFVIYLYRAVLHALLKYRYRTRDREAVCTTSSPVADTAVYDPTPLSRAIEAEIHDALPLALNRLHPTYRQVLSQYYGLDDSPTRQHVIARDLAAAQQTKPVTHKTICCYHGQALHHLAMQIPRVTRDPKAPPRPRYTPPPRSDRDRLADLSDLQLAILRHARSHRLTNPGHAIDLYNAEVCSEHFGWRPTRPIRDAAGDIRPGTVFDRTAIGLRLYTSVSGRINHAVKCLDQFGLVRRILGRGWSGLTLTDEGLRLISTETATLWGQPLTLSLTGAA